jgi:hypothetical protein
MFVNPCPSAKEALCFFVVLSFKPCKSLSGSTSVKHRVIVVSSKPMPLSSMIVFLRRSCGQEVV